MAIYGYCRVSTPKQRIERQIDNIKALYPEAVILKEAYTGRTTSRPEFDKLIRKVKPGDKIVFDEVSRMSRNASEGFALYEKLFNEGVELVFIKEPHINTETYKKALQSNVSLTGTKIDPILTGVNEFLMNLAKDQIELAFQTAQRELEFLSQRTKEGLRRARLEGRSPGRPKDRNGETNKSQAAKRIILKHSKTFGGTLTDMETMALAKISLKSYYKYKKELKETAEKQNEHKNEQKEENAPVQVLEDPS